MYSLENNISSDFRIYNFEDRNSWPRNEIGIYCLSGDYNGKVIVGQTQDSGGFWGRWRCHANDLLNNRHRNSYLQNSFNNHNSNEFKFVILEVCPDNQDILNQKEVFWIDYFNSLNRTYGWNLRHGGDRNYIYSEETLSKMSISAKKRGISERTRLKMSQNRKGKYCKEKNPFYGKTHTPEAIEKNRLAHMGKVWTNKLYQVKCKLYKFLSPRNEIVEFFGLNQFCRDNNLNAGHMAQVNLGRKEHHKGWRKYYD